MTAVGFRLQGGPKADDEDKAGCEASAELATLAALPDAKQGRALQVCQGGKQALLASFRGDTCLIRKQEYMSFQRAPFGGLVLDGCEKLKLKVAYMLACCRC